MSSAFNQIINFDNLIKKVINGPPSNPDWRRILNVISLVDDNPGIDFDVSSNVCKHLPHGSSGRKMNCLILIDALFKNAKSHVLRALQTRTLMNALDQDIIKNDASLHNFLYDNMLSWIDSCLKNKVLDNKFSEWVTKYRSTHFVPNLTSKIRKKFFRDLNGCIEILTMLTECLANYSQTDKSLLGEIAANAEEIARRLRDLQPTIVDKQLTKAISVTREFCEKCIHENLAFQKGQMGDLSELFELASKAANTVNLASKPPPKQPKQTRVPPKFQNENTDITDSEFFERLRQLKLKNNQVQPQQQMNDLLSPPNQAQSIVTDSLIDF